MIQLFAYFWRYRWRWGWGLVMLLCTNATTLATPQLVRFVVDAITYGAQPEHIRSIAITMVLVALCGAVFRSLSRIHIFFSARDVEMDLRCDFYRHLTRQQPSFYTRHSTGDIMSRATHDLSQVRLLLGPGLLNVVNTVVAYLGAFPLMFAISPKLTLLSFAIYPPSLFIVRRIAKSLYERNRSQQETMGKLSAYVQENLAGAHVVRAFARENQQQEAFEEHNQASYEANIKLAFMRAIMWRLMMVLATAGALVAVVLGAREVIANRLTLGEVVALMEYLAILSWPTFALGWVLSMWQRGAASMSRLRELLDVEPEIVSGKLEPKDIEPRLELRDLRVNFDTKAALDGLSVTVEPGETLGVVGPIGSGKSTLVRALMRLIHVEPNQVFVGGYDITELTLPALRACLGYVPQTHVMFSDTLANNVGFGAPHRSHEDITRVLRAAALDPSDPSLPSGLETPVGERGISLSGGQKQRASIARALLVDPPILILDDALASVDAETEAEILKHLRDARQGKTTVIVSHRVTAVKHAEQIVVLDNGCAIERGTHETLQQQKGLYASMVRRQQLAQEIGESEPHERGVA